MRATMRRLGYRNTHKYHEKRVYEKNENGFILGIAFTEIGEICDFYVYKRNKKFLTQKDIDNLQIEYRTLLNDLRRLANGAVS